MDLGYRANFSDGAVDFFITLPRRRQRKLLDRARQLVTDPFVVPDYQTRDTDERDIAHLMVGGFFFTFWVDHAAKVVLITEIEDAE